MAANLLNDKPAAFMLYCYFSVNQGEYQFALSPAWIEEELGLSYGQYEHARNKLKEVGYLIPRRGEKDSYDFVRVPLRYADITLDELEFLTHKEKWHQKRNTKVKSQESCAGEVCLDDPEVSENELPEQLQSALPGESTLLPEPESGSQRTPQRSDSSTLKRGDQTYLKGGRNIINSIRNSTNNISGNQQEKNVEELRKEISEWVERIRMEFGDLEECEEELLKAEWTARSKRYSEKKYILLLEKCFDTLKKRVENEARYQRSMYEQACEATIPKDYIVGMKVRLILDKLVAEGRIPSRYGAWIQGWDEEQQMVKLTAYSEDLPLEVIRLQRHVLDGIPDRYWKKPKAG